jgi:dihydrodipicolinate synthase/N-acetylneuraminate lyase
MKLKKKYNGLVVPSITPLTENYKLDHKAVEKMFDNFSSHDGSPFILGTTGEAPSLPAEVKLDFIKTATRFKSPDRMLYAGIAANCVEESVDMAKLCADEGIDAVVAHLPTYFTLSEYEIKKYFETLADQIPLPLIMYNIPATTHISIPLTIIDELSYHDNIVGIKDSERNVQRLNHSFNLWTNRADFSHFLGWAAQSAFALFNGCDGLVPSTGNLCPDIYQEMLNAVDKDDQRKAFALQAQSNLLGDLYQSKRTLGGSLAALKSLMQGAGLCQPYVMAPLNEVSQQDADELEQKLQEIIAIENIKLPFYQ